MMSPTLYNHMLTGMTATAFVVFVCLYCVTAGYGQFRTRSWGWSINNKLAWILMEAPAFAVMLYVWLSAGASRHVPELVLLLLFLLHYFQRSFVFPLLMQGSSQMPVVIMLLAQWHVVAGIVLFFVGLAINWHSDHVIRHLRQPGDTRHYLPSRGMYRYVTSANYLGEIVEWTGFALAASNTAAWVFVLWTAANLVPRAHAIHRKYRSEFGDAAVGNRKRIIPYIY